MDNYAPGYYELILVLWDEDIQDYVDPYFIIRKTGEITSQRVNPDHFFDIFENGCRHHYYSISGKEQRDLLDIFGDNGHKDYAPETVIDFYTGLAMQLSHGRILSITGFRLTKGVWTLEMIEVPPELEADPSDFDDEIDISALSSAASLE